jgi:hypothetical protein
MVAQAGQAKRALCGTRASSASSRSRSSPHPRSRARRRRTSSTCSTVPRWTTRAASRSRPLGAFSMLDRSDRGIATRRRTRARCSGPYARYVIFNSPENCSDAACGVDDILIDPSDHSARFSAPQVAATYRSVVWGSAGAVANANPVGRLKLDGDPGRG